MISPEELKRLRKELHAYPEVSGKEDKTARRIKKWLGALHPDRIISGIGGYGVAAVFGKPGSAPNIMFRCELDALPIEETNDFSHRSKHAYVSHKCGHDGHMAILLGLAAQLADERPEQGCVTLLFQPAEETGTGADLVLADKKFRELEPDYIFALHNLPGFKKNSIILRHGSFSSASIGMIMKLTGRSSHASEPEKGINPAPAVAQIIKDFYSLIENRALFRDFTLGTIIHARIGEVAFGTNPGNALIMATLRAYLNEDLELLRKKTAEIAEKAADEGQLSFEKQWTEEFRAYDNDSLCVDMIEQIAETHGLEITRPEHPFRWSEDFAHFLERYKGAMFGLGAGMDHPAVHSPDYDYPDDITETGIRMFSGIYKRLLKRKDK